MVYIVNKENKINEEEKDEKKMNKNIDKNIIRDLSSYYKNFINLTVGTYYGFIHGLIVFLGGFTVVFSNNLLYLCIILFIVSLDAFAIVTMHDCPLTQLEEKYLGLSGKRNTKEFLHNLGIVHKCDHLYESQLEFVINMWMIVVMKILILIVYGMCKNKFL
jgi:hypothetical protein